MHTVFYTMPSSLSLENFYKRLFRQNETAIKFGIEAVSSAIRLTPNLIDYPHICVAGTNGKGQISAFLSNACSLIGMRCGLFTSPHLVDFRERIRIDGEPIPAQDLLVTGSQILAEFGGEPGPGASGITLTYFECCLMMALRFFHEKQVSFGIFEAGLGGRLDATNALSPSMTVITSIGMDHTQYLGNTTSQIALEKAGLMRPGCPVISGRQEISTLESHARELGCASFEALGRDFDWKESQGMVCLSFKNEEIPLPGAENLPSFQRDNAAVASYALIRAEQLGILPARIRPVLKKLIPSTRWPGRMWTCSLESARNYGIHSIILDGAHNPDAMRVLCNEIRTQSAPKALITNSCRDKAIEDIAAIYRTVFPENAIFAVPIHTTPRSCAPDEYCHRAGIPETQATESLNQALERAASIIGNQGTVYISGSLYLIGEAMTLLGESPFGILRKTSHEK